MCRLYAFLFVLTASLSVDSLAALPRDFYLYQLQVFCGDPQVATVIFNARGPGTMGTKVICAGNCQGKNVTVEEAIAGLPNEVLANFRSQITKHEENAAAGKGQSVAGCGAKCNPDRYNDYLRKRQVAMELYKHASDLRLSASKLVAERWGAESKNLGIETFKEAGGDLAWQKVGPAVDWHLANKRKWLHEEWVLRDKWIVRNSRTLGRKAADNAPFSVNAWGKAGWVFEIALTARRAISTWSDYIDYQKEAQEATKKAEEMWRAALANLEAYLKQKCSEDSKEFLADQDRLDRAKLAIEEWDNNQNLYWDPIKNEAVVFEEAVRRAAEYLKSGKISSLETGPIYKLASFSVNDDPPSQAALAAAIKELDKAIAAWKKLDPTVSKYLQAQRAIEQKLDAAFGISASRPTARKEGKQ